MNYPTLFSPFEAGRLALRNRLMHAAITTSYAKDGVVSKAFHNYYINRAKGGVAALVLEPSNVLSSQTDGRRPDILNATQLAPLCRLVEAVEDEDCRFVAQLQDNGRGRREQGRGNAAIGPSALPDDLSWTVPHVLQCDDIKRIIDEFTQSCLVFQKAGFSGVELSAGHGHLFHQFLSPWSNRREDEYGGSTNGRTLLIRQLIDSIRSACSSRFAIGLKLPGADSVDNDAGGLNIAEAKAIAIDIAQSSDIDYWTFVWGSHSNSLHEHLPDAHGQPNPYMQLIRELRQSAPQIATGSLGYMTDPNQAEKTLTDGTADIAMLGRPLITDANWPIKVKAGKEADIRYCVSCNTCWHMIIETNKLQCDNNPRLGEADETDWNIELVAAPKQITVIGAGVAGMEAAWMAAAKGHKVSVLSQSDEVGGKTRIHAALPGGENLSSIYDYQLLMAQRYGVSFTFNVIADVQTVVDTQPDEVILATGSSMTWPSFLPVEYQGEGFFLDLRSLMFDLATITQKQTGKVVIYDQDHTEMTYNAAQRLAEIFEQVVIVTSRERIASDVSLIARQGIYKRLSQLHVQIITLSEPLNCSAFEDGQLTLRNIYNGSETVIDNIAVLTYSTSRVPNDSLLKELQQHGYSVRTVGDAYAPRSVLSATREGYLAAKHM
jgi:2,4-dienoyl-CoA reductase-like NADH-dependent reductase (Old Yellow Enzyme family)/thioredoxin reductase